jgi:hypothetical protein
MSTTPASNSATAINNSISRICEHQVSRDFCSNGGDVRNHQDKMRALQPVECQCGGAGIHVVPSLLMMQLRRALLQYYYIEGLLAGLRPA